MSSAGKSVVLVHGGFVDGTAGKASTTSSSGDAGVGKSALLDEAAGTAAASGYTVIRTAGAEAESEMGFAALTAVVHHIGTDTIAAVEPRYAQALKVALGAREAPTPAPVFSVRLSSRR